MREALTPEQKEIALQARRNYYRNRKEERKRSVDAYWYRRGLREMEAAEKEEAKSNAEAVTTENG